MGMCLPSRFWRARASPWQLVTGRGSEAHCSGLPTAHRDDILGVRLALDTVQARHGCPKEAMAAAAADLEQVRLVLPAKLEIEVATFLQAWLLAERGETREAILILEVDPRRDSAPVSTTASAALRAAWHHLHAACLFATGPPRAVEAVLNRIAGLQR
jgi:hypothetical protein